MQVKINSGVPFNDHGTRRIGIVKEIEEIDGQYLIVVSVRGRRQVITSKDIVHVQPVNYKPLTTMTDLIGH